MIHHRDYPQTYGTHHPPVFITSGEPCPLPGGRVPLARGIDTPRVTGPGVQDPLPLAIVNAAGVQPFAGMDPSDPSTFVRPWNPQPGMIARLNFDGAQRQGMTPTGGVRRNRHRDRADVPSPRPRWGGLRRRPA